MHITSISSLQTKPLRFAALTAANGPAETKPEVQSVAPAIPDAQKEAQDVVSFMSQANVLKDLNRKGWLRIGVKEPESVAAHSWSTAMLALLLTPKNLDVNRTVKYALLHDLAEAYIGDITPRDGISPEECSKLETKAINKLCESFPHLKKLWTEFELNLNSEAAFCKQIDRLDMGIQMMLYSKRGHRLSDFIETCKKEVTHPKLKPVLDEVIRRINIQNYKSNKTEK